MALSHLARSSLDTSYGAIVASVLPAYPSYPSGRVRDLVRDVPSRHAGDAFEILGPMARRRGDSLVDGTEGFHLSTSWRDVK